MIMLKFGPSFFIKVWLISVAEKEARTLIESQIWAVTDATKIWQMSSLYFDVKSIPRVWYKFLDLFLIYFSPNTVVLPQQIACPKYLVFRLSRTEQKNAKKFDHLITQLCPEKNGSQNISAADRAKKFVTKLKRHYVHNKKEKTNSSWEKCVEACNLVKVKKIPPPLKNTLRARKMKFGTDDKCLLNFWSPSKNWRFSIVTSYLTTMS